MARSTIAVDEAVKVEDMTLNASTVDAEVKFVGIWGADLQFHKERVVRGVVIADEVALEDDEDEMTEEEEYRRKNDAEVARTKACLMTNKKKVFTDARRNAFLPLASPRWVETMSTAFSGRIWSLETFNYLAPIDQRGYRLLASLTQDEMKAAFERALDMNTAPPEVKFPFNGDGIFLPPMSSMDVSKCSLPRPNVSIKGNKPPQNPPALAELKRVWNVGRPYLKCRCCYEGKADCGTRPPWFDHLIWFLLHNLDILYPDAPTPRVKVSSLIKCLSTCWKPLMLLSLSFGCVREVMMLLDKKSVANPSLTIDSVLVGMNGADRKTFKECVKLLLMSKYIKKRPRLDEGASSSGGKRGRTDGQGTMHCFMCSTPPDQPDKPDASTPSESTITSVGGKRVGLSAALNGGNVGHQRNVNRAIFDN
ncbi:hypothetical protein CBR_g23166 [Chara braunii]|uniref:Uncharacterized protein n=1 Tax=Chara braunii TaxID=69332 RepID=A0A388L3Y1_CHABU|nr:hypothetical protein CBR_g23166 [Chara braunii]|eukprot:GBG76952.1 hypothetical protein CBR_g23166 [Chara braunii]